MEGVIMCTILGATSEIQSGSDGGWWAVGIRIAFTCGSGGCPFSWGTLVIDQLFDTTHVGSSASDSYSSEGDSSLGYGVAVRTLVFPCYAGKNLSSER
jgi:hypothetical protein